MGVSKESKDKILNLLIQRVPTEEIARRLNYSIGTVRKVFEELRDEYGVSTTKEIADIYLDSTLLKELTKLNNCLNSVIKKIKSRKFATSKKSRHNGQKHKK